jgi:hypothetical protein
LAHFIYEWSGKNFIAGLFVPVNESTWEHMKLVFFPMIIYTVFVENRLSNDYPCILPAHCIGILIGTWLVAVLFYSYSGILGFNVFILDLAVFIASVLIAFWIAYKLTLSNFCLNMPRQIKILFFILVILMAICFMIYSYNPLGIGLFREP